ncbi:NADH-quinone oxidoreductase subunit J [Spirosoma daeguense]
MTEFLNFFKALTPTGYVFLILTALTLFSAIGVVTARNPIFSVLALIATFFCLSGHYILLNAQFLAAVNIIVYAGAIMVLFLFTIMFLNLRREDEESKTNLTKMASVVVGGLLMVMLITIFRAKSAQVPTVSPNSPFDPKTGLVEQLGSLLYSDYILPFELVSVLFLVAMVGAVMLGKREAGDRHF